MASEDQQTSQEDAIRELEERKLSVQEQITQLQADVYKIDHEMLMAGASTERINQTLRW